MVLLALVACVLSLPAQGAVRKGRNLVRRSPRSAVLPSVPSLEDSFGATPGFNLDSLRLSPGGSPSWFPVLLQLANGDVLCAFNTHSELTGSGTDIYVCRSGDGGISWGLPTLAVAGSGLSLCNGKMLQLPNGDILMSYTDGKATSTHPGHVWLARSVNGGLSWQPSYALVHTSALTGLWESSLTLLPSGRLLCHFASEEHAPTYPNAIFQCYSDDQGTNWSAAKRVVGVSGSRDGVPSVVRLATGRLMMFFEAQDWWDVSATPIDFLIRSVYSDNDGTSWSRERKLVSMPKSTVAGHRHTAPQAVLLPNGKILVTFYTSEGGNPRPIDRYTDMAYVESDAPYDNWTPSRYLVGLAGESDRWGYMLGFDNAGLLYSYTRDVTTSASHIETARATYNYNASDSFAGRMSLGADCGQLSASNSNATREALEPVHATGAAGKSLWWKWTAPAAGKMEIDTSASNFDTILAVYSGSSLGSLAAVASNDDSAPGKKTSAVSFATAAGVEYQIALDGGAAASSGYLGLRWNFSTAPPAAPAGPVPAVAQCVSLLPATFQWNACPGASSYDVYIDGALVGNVTTNQWTVTSLPAGVWHSWQVKAKNASGVTSGPADWTFWSPDLRLVSADFSPATPTALQPGDRLNVSWNLDGTPTSSNIWFELFASKSGGLDVERLGGTATNSFTTVHGGGVVSYAPTDQNLTFIPDGVYTLVASVNRVSLPARVDEVNFANNMIPIAGKRIYVHNTQTPVCDLAWQSPPAFTVSGNAFRVQGTLVNKGSGASPDYGFWVETAYGNLTPEGFFQVGGYVGDGARLGAVAPGQAVGYTKTGSIPSGYTALAAVIDSTDLVPETDETNNYCINKTPVPGSGTTELELVSASISPAQLAPTALNQGEMLQWNCTVRNPGSVDSGPVWFELFASTNGGLDFIRAGTTLTSSELRNVPAGTTQNFSFVQPVNKVTDGIYSVVAVVNRAGTGGPLEANASNNRKVLSGRVLLHNTAPALANLKWQSGPTVTRNGLQISVSGTVTNNGTGDSGPFWTEVFYGYYDVSGWYVKVGSLTMGDIVENLAPGQPHSFSQSGTLPAGRWVLGVAIDSSDIVPETDETDNYVRIAPQLP